ncbi:beta-mannanase [Frankia sp. AgPm24]|nr:beta-mannanase [Frankia sp. AgPm24]
MLLGLAVLVAMLVASVGTALPASALTSTIEDTDIGNAAGRVAYVGAWIRCAGCTPPTPNTSYHYARDRGAVAAIRFTGTGIQIYGIANQSGGRVSIAVDGGQPTVVDTYAPTRAPQLLRTITGLTDGGHTAVLANTGTSNAASGGTVVTFDRAVVTTGSSEPALGFRSGLPWLSGVWANPNMIPQNTDAFCAFRGSPCDLAHVFVARDNWASIVAPSFAQLNYQNWPGRLLISVPPFPENSGNSLQACAAGAYDTNWRTFGTTLNTTARQDSIIRLAWQANGNWFQWQATDAAAYRGCWQHIATAIRSTANPDPVLDWTINAHYSQLPASHHPLDLYPGDAYVDSIGIDSYDAYPPSTTLAQFNQQAQAEGGITWLYDFAQQHGKRFGVGEWGVASGAGSNGAGDNQSYIGWMWDWFQAHAGQTLLYDAYFNSCEPDNVGSNLNQPPGADCVFTNPRSAARYRALWGGAGGQPSTP